VFDEYGLVYEDYDLKKLNTYKVSCKARYLIIVNDIIKLTMLFKYIMDNKIKYFIIGNGSNIILPSIYDGVVIKLDFNGIEFNRNKVTVPANYLLPQLVNTTIDHGLSGLEWASGIPGTIGGAVIANAGAYKDEICNYIEELEVIENNKIRIIKRNEIDFAYRFCSLKYRDLIILKVTLNLKKGNKEKSLEVIKEHIEKRKSSQPLDKPSAGSVFRNPEGFAAGKLIDDLNLKGYKIGGAEISKKHANFIINTGDATGEDIVKLINYIKKRVEEEYHIDLVLEQQIIF
jgi:UDP-N-acetylmuramate dehydrogenase